MKKEEKILFWSERVQEFYSNGQTYRTWCQEHQVPVSTMSYWIRKLKNVNPVSVKEDAPVFAKMPTEQELRRKELVSSQPSSSISDLLKMNVTTEYVAHVYAFSNAVAYLKRNSYIEPTGVKGSYRVIKKKSKSVDESTEEFKTLNKELELKEMREKVKKCVRETYLELEKILDEEKPSVYGRNKHTYEDVTTLIEYMRKFDFIVEE